MIRILSIDTRPNHEPTAEHGQYNLVVEVGDTPHRLEYTCDFYEKEGLRVQSVTWKPEDSVLSNRKEVSLSAAMAINDTVVQYHQTKSVEFPRIIE